MFMVVPSVVICLLRLIFGTWQWHPKERISPPQNKKRVLLGGIEPPSTDSESAIIPLDHRRPVLFLWVQAFFWIQQVLGRRELALVTELRVLGSPECTVRIWFHNVLLRNAVGSCVARRGCTWWWLWYHWLPINVVVGVTCGDSVTLSRVTGDEGSSGILGPVVIACVSSVTWRLRSVTTARSS